MSEPTSIPGAHSAGLDFTAVAGEQRQGLLRYLRRWIAPADAEDAVQQAFLRIASMDSARAAVIRSPASYWRTTALNIVRDHTRSAQRSPLISEPLEPEEHAGPDPMALLEARDMLRRLEAVVAKMPARRREIFLAHRIDGYSYAEIAARTGLSVKGVEKQMSRAIAQIDRLASRR